MNFSSIRFGKASAEAESQDDPDLLINGFLDAEGITTKALEGVQFLFLGYKGSGKTSLAEHLRLRAAQNPNLFVRHEFLSAFPYRSFQKIVSGAAEPESKYPTAWSWILLLLLLASLVEDQGIEVQDSSGFESAVSKLRKIGLLPIGRLHDLVVTSSKRSFKVNIPFDFGVEYESDTVAGEDVRFLQLVENLKRVITSVRSKSKHILVIDGLDDILSERDIQYQSLAALMIEVMRLNNLMRAAGCPTKIVVLCRTDLYERLPGPNKNKIRQDYSVEFDWYHDPREPNASRLVRAANLRASLAEPSIKDIFAEFFPESFNDSSTIPWLLTNTRHTPRDFLQMLVHLQKYWISGRYSRDQILSGLRDYSINYFMPEIKDELVGYVSADQTELVLKLLASIGKREFRFSELEAAKASRPRYAEIDLERICDILYECSAIGHIESQPNGSHHFAFKFRNRHSTFNPSRVIILHRGVWKAMNLT